MEKSHLLDSSALWLFGIFITLSLLIGLRQLQTQNPKHDTTDPEENNNTDPIKQLLQQFSDGVALIEKK